MTYKEALEKIATVNAMDYEYQAWAKEALAQPEPVKLWLWKNFVDGRPEYWAFDNAFPINMNDGDPQTLGEPCGYAWLKPSRQGRFDVSDKEVLSAIKNAKEYPPQPKEPEQEPVAWRETRSKVIKALAAIVTVHTPDKLFDLDAIPRDPVMHLVQQIKAAIDGYKPPQRKPLTDEQIADMWQQYNPLKGIASFARAIEAAHGIKE